jgi:hypothetical protein
VSIRTHKLTKDEIARAFTGKAAEEFPVILSPAQLAALLQMSPKTISEWINKGRLDGTFRKRGKHNLIWRDRAIDLIFNGKEWASNEK